MAAPWPLGRWRGVGIPGGCNRPTAKTGIDGKTIARDSPMTRETFYHILEKNYMETVSQVAPCIHGWLHDMCWFLGAYGHVVDGRDRVRASLAGAESIFSRWSLLNLRWIVEVQHVSCIHATYAWHMCHGYSMHRFFFPFSSNRALRDQESKFSDGLGVLETKPILATFGFTNPFR